VAHKTFNNLVLLIKTCSTKLLGEQLGQVFLVKLKLKISCQAEIENFLSS